MKEKHKLYKNNYHKRLEIYSRRFIILGLVINKSLGCIEYNVGNMA